MTALESRGVRTCASPALIILTRPRVSVCSLTMEEVVGKMQTGHKTMVQNMIDDFKQCSPPAKVLQPLQTVLEEAAKRGHAFFNVVLPILPL